MRPTTTITAALFAAYFLGLGFEAAFVIAVCSRIVLVGITRRNAEAARAARPQTLLKMLQSDRPA